MLKYQYLGVCISEVFMRQRNPQYFEKADYSWSSDSIRYINTPTRTARQTFFYVQEVGDFDTQFPYFTERSNLDSFYIMYTSEGKGRLIYCDEEYLLYPGSIVWINCMNHHRYECLANQHWKFLWLHFNGLGSLGYFNEFIKNGFHVIKESDRNFIETTMMRILALTQKKESNSEIIISSLIMQLITQLLIENSSQSLGLGVTPDYINKAVKHIGSHFMEHLTLDDLSDMFGLNKYYFAKQFKSYVGTPPNEYILMTRIAHAKELLKYSDETIEDISYRCGFHQVSHFISTFKKHEAVTPLQFRKDWK